MKVVNPRTGQADYEIVPATRDDIAHKAKQLRSAQPAWHKLGPSARAFSSNPSSSIIAMLASAAAAHVGCAV